MKLLFDEDLVEAGVFLCASGRRKGAPSLQIRRFQGEREKLYAILDPDERNSAFFRLHLDWFREWGLEAFLARQIHEFPLLEKPLKALAFRKARHKPEEGSELYVNASGERHGIVALLPEHFEDDAALSRFLHHELMHLSDMVDPAFAYSPCVQLPGQTDAQQRLTRERYRLLWDVVIDGRLVNSGRTTIAAREQRRAEFDKVYSFWPEAKREETFEALWTNPAPTHQRLLALAADPRDVSAAHQPLPGAACLLCGFPTFHWADNSSLDLGIEQAIRLEFPMWTPLQGVCSRCVEMYQSASKHLLKAQG